MYRIELDALNALVEEQRKTNELLDDLKKLLTVKPPQEAEKPKRGKANANEQKEPGVLRTGERKRAGVNNS